MPVFDVNRNAVSKCYDARGNALTKVYDKDSNVIDLSGITVMSFNVQRWKGINADESLMSAIFNKYKPDIVGFQEYDTSKALGDTAAAEYLQKHWKHLFVGDTTIENYTKAISSHFALEDASTTYYSTYYESRSYQKAYVNIGGKRVAVFNTHLDVSLTYNAPQAKELFDAVSQEEYFILIADLNTVCTSTEDESYTGVLKQFADAGYNLANGGEFGFLDMVTDGTTADNGTWKQTDNIITSANIAINKVVVDTLKIEANTGLTIDHLPLVAHLTVS